MFKRALRGSIRRLMRWVDDESNGQRPVSPEDSEFAYPWLNSLFVQMAKDGLRRSYAWGVLQGVNLARAIGIGRVSVVEFGVAGGNGQIALEEIAERVESLLGVGVDVYGFDSGVGLPRPSDYRDVPNLASEGLYQMDHEKLRRRLRRARLVLGDIGETLPAFVEAKPAPIAFIACDVVLHSSTVQALRVFEADHVMLLPRVHSYFDDVLGFTYGDCNGERLAIGEFNAKHVMRKISPIYGLKYYLPAPQSGEMWVEKYWIAHIFDHPLYGRRDNLVRRHMLDLAAEKREL